MDWLKSEKYQLNNVLAARSRLGEGPVWDSTKGLLYWDWVDIYNHRASFNHSLVVKISKYNG